MRIRRKSNQQRRKRRVIKSSRRKSPRRKSPRRKSPRRKSPRRKPIDEDENNNYHHNYTRGYSDSDLGDLIRGQSTHILSARSKGIDNSHALELFTNHY